MRGFPSFAPFSKAFCIYSLRTNIRKMYPWKILQSADHIFGMPVQKNAHRIPKYFSPKRISPSTWAFSSSTEANFVSGRSNSQNCAVISLP